MVNVHSVHKKWTIQCEADRKLVTVIVRHFSLRNKTRTSKVGAISKAQKKRKTFFWKKNEIFENFFHSKKVA